MAAIREMLVNIYADDLAEECFKQMSELLTAKHEKVEAYLNYFLSRVAMLSIDIQMALFKTQNDAESAPAPKITDEATGVKKSILAVDDNSFFLNMLKSTLQDSGYKLICVTSAMSALRFVQTHQPDLFILDIEMPEMNGYELADELRKCGQYAPIIFLTGNATKEYVNKAMEAGAADFIVKPINQKYVLERVGKFI
jgi:CheY-like chemotaxis protein